MEKITKPEKNDVKQLINDVTTASLNTGGCRLLSMHRNFLLYEKFRLLGEVDKEAAHPIWQVKQRWARRLDPKIMIYKNLFLQTMEQK